MGVGVGVPSVIESLSRRTLGLHANEILQCLCSAGFPCLSAVAFA